MQWQGDVSNSKELLLPRDGSEVLDRNYNLDTDLLAINLNKLFYSVNFIRHIGKYQ